MTLPALHHGADIRSITERVNVLIRDYNNPPAPPAPTPVQRLVPAGTLLPFAGAAAPTGFLLCHGQAVSRTDYADLFTVIGTTYGAGNGTTTFNLPDLQGRVVAGREAGATRLTSGVSGINGAALGAVGGDQRLHQHNHGVNDAGHVHGAGGGASFLTATTGDGSFLTVNGGVQFNTFFKGVTGSAGTGITIQNNGAGSSQNVQPTIVLNYVIAT